MGRGEARLDNNAELSTGPCRSDSISFDVMPTKTVVASRLGENTKSEKKKKKKMK